MAVTFTICPFEIVADDKAGIVIEDRKTGQFWRLSNDQARGARARALDSSPSQAD